MHQDAHKKANEDELKANEDKIAGLETEIKKQKAEADQRNGLVQ